MAWTHRGVGDDEVTDPLGGYALRHRRGRHRRHGGGMTDENARLIEIAEQHGWHARTVARVAGVRYNGGFRDRLRRLRSAGSVPSVPAVSVEFPPSEDLPIEDLLDERERRFALKREHEDATKLITVRVQEDGPFAINMFGDPHVDDDGTDIALLRAHTDLVKRSAGIYAATVGDVRNNWVGRLAKLWAEQSTSARDALRIARWWIEELEGKWLFIVGGNHDAWSGHDDPLEWITGQVQALYQSSEVRVAVTLPSGRQFFINCRHDHPGHSMWNAAHGPAKAIQLGIRDHVAIAGHTHITGYNILKDPDTCRTCHAVRLPSYKLIDRYAKQGGFRDNALGPSGLLVVDPRLPDSHPDLIKPYWDPFEGADYLAFKRRRQAA